MKKYRVGITSYAIVEVENEEVPDRMKGMVKFYDNYEDARTYVILDKAFKLGSLFYAILNGAKNFTELAKEGDKRVDELANFLAKKRDETIITS